MHRFVIPARLFDEMNLLHPLEVLVVLAGGPVATPPRPRCAGPRSQLPVCGTPPPTAATAGATSRCLPSAVPQSKYLQHILLFFQSILDGVVTEQPFTDGAGTVEPCVSGPVHQRIEPPSKPRLAVDARPVLISLPIAQITHDDHRVDNPQRPYRVVVINPYPTILTSFL